MDLLPEEIDSLDSGALFSPCRRWRYLLWRRWNLEGDLAVFIGLNPSTADELTDDPTIRRCIGFAKSWGYGALWMLNAYAWRATNPAEMRAQGANAIGPRNNEYIFEAALYADMVIAAWGVHCDDVRERQVAQCVEAAGKPLRVLGLTKEGHPKHPLYLPGNLQPFDWQHGFTRRQRA